jgi:hypothetical protein
MKKRTKKLVLSKETLRSLQLVLVSGGTSGVDCGGTGYCGSGIGDTCTCEGIGSCGTCPWELGPTAVSRRC